MWGAETSSARHIEIKKMKELNGRTTLIIWDIALMVGIMLLVFKFIPENYSVMTGFLTAIILSTCVRNHIAAYKLTGKIY
jgi:hypothetical protein